MSKTANLVLGITLLLIGLVGIAAVAMSGRPGGITSSCPGGACGGLQGSSATPSQPAATGVDAMFIEQMIPHHDDAIEMAELALTRAEHPELKQLAEDVVRTQTEQNAQMRLFYRDWFDADVPANGSAGFGMMGGGMMGGTTDLTALEDATDFDKAFIEQMIPHHQMGIMMSQMAGNATSREEIRDLTDSIITGQSEEIQSMQTWYREWYSR